MIAGTLVIEDSTITFNAFMHSNMGQTVQYTVSDNLTGQHETKTVPAKDFMMALSVALSYDGEFSENCQENWDAIESVQPDNKNLRFIP